MFIISVSIVTRINEIVTEPRQYWNGEWDLRFELFLAMKVLYLREIFIGFITREAPTFSIWSSAVQPSE